LASYLRDREIERTFEAFGAFTNRELSMTITEGEQWASSDVSFFIATSIRGTVLPR